jgi:hypothetical protein
LIMIVQRCPSAHVALEDERYCLCVDSAELSKVTDDELIALIATLDAGGHARGELGVVMEELFRRIRADAAPGERSSVEAAIVRLKWIFSHDDDGPAAGGVREPRQPPPDFDAGAVRLAS